MSYTVVNEGSSANTYRCTSSSNGTIVFKSGSGSGLSGGGAYAYVQIKRQMDVELTISIETTSNNTFITLNKKAFYYNGTTPPSGTISGYSTGIPSGWNQFVSYPYNNSNPISTFTMTTNVINLNGGDYFGIMFAGTDRQQSKEITMTITSFPSADGLTCFLGNCRVLMADKMYKEISLIKRGDILIEDVNLNKCNTVARVSKYSTDAKYCIIPKNTIGNTIDIGVAKPHPIWCNDGNNRVFAKNIHNTMSTEGFETFYNIQYEDEGTYYVEGIKVDSLPPCNKSWKLAEKLFYDKSKYDPKRVVMGENDPSRCKPPMTDNYENIDLDTMYYNK